MRNFIFFAVTVLLIAGLLVGCDADRRGAKVAPQSELDAKDQTGYDRESGGDYDPGGEDGVIIGDDNGDLFFRFHFIAPIIRRFTIFTVYL